MCIYLVLLSFPFLTPFHFNVGGLKYIYPPFNPPEKVVSLNEMTWSLRRTTREGGDIGLKIILNHKAYKLVLLFVGLKTIGSFVIDWEEQTKGPIFFLHIIIILLIFIEEELYQFIVHCLIP